MVAITRRALLRAVGAAGTGAVAPSATAAATGPADAVENCVGVLVDTTACIGCRKCEWACNRVNKLPAQPIETFEDRSVFGAIRRPDATHYTVVNSFPAAAPGGAPVYVKVQCMHCNDPACVSACLVSALVKRADGAVTYDPWRCMGCRYCMVVCPFGIPAYEYRNPTTPRVRKCGFCHERFSREGRLPACVEICPPQCLTFGPRDELLGIAHRLIRGEPGRYIDHVYGEHEAGGSSWLYLAGAPFAGLQFPTLGSESPARLTETLQHGLFRDFIPPLSLFAVLGTVMALFRPAASDDDRGEGDEG